MERMERVLKLARTLAGAEDAEALVLEPLCAAALERWSARVRSGVPLEKCAEALECAAAYAAAADWLAAQRGVSAFAAGELSVKLGDGGRSAAEMRRTAETLMAPFACPDDLFLQGVRGD